MIRGVSVSLPAAAEAKLGELELTRDGAYDAARAAAGRLNNLPRDADQQMRDRLTSERDRHNHRHAQISQLVHRLNQWLMELRGVALVSTSPVDVALEPNETLSTAIVNVRAEIARLRQHLAAVRTAPLPIEDQEQLAEAYVVRALAAARPTVAVVGDQMRVTFRDSVVAGTDDVLALLCWCCPEQVWKALTRSIREQPVRADAMSAEERTRRVTELEAQLSALEHREEALVLRAAGDGLEVLRRPDASPAAVLGVVVVARQTAAA
jgi:hypothetical protein